MRIPPQILAFVLMAACSGTQTFPLPAADVVVDVIPDVTVLEVVDTAVVDVDVDVVPKCGNGVLDPGEPCDGELLGVESCTTLGFSGGQLACRADCLGFVNDACDRDPATNEPDNPCPSGEHLCNYECVPDSPYLGCGPNCELCPSVADAQTYCASGVCGWQCAAGMQLCGGVCATCPSGANTACDGTSCTGTVCPKGQYDVDGSCAAWTIHQDVGDTTNYPSSPSVAVGSDGVRHIAYYNGWSGGIRYARYNGSWTDEAAAPVQDGGPGIPRIALDPAGQPHIAAALLDANGDELGLAHFWRDAGGWHNELVVEGLETTADIAIGADGTVHIAVRRILAAGGAPGEHSEIVYARKGSSDPTFALTTIDAEDAVGQQLGWPRMVLTGPNTFAIAYRDDLILRVQEGTAEAFFRSVVAYGDILRPALAVSRDGDLAAVYVRFWEGEGWTTDIPANQIFYAIRQGGKWTEQPLFSAPGEYMGFGIGLGFGAGGRAVISHYEGSNVEDDSGTLRVLRQTATGWEHQAIDDGAQAGLFSDLAMDSQGRPTIVCEDLKRNKLMLYTLD